MTASILDSISDNAAANPYVIKIAPGVYTESSAVALKDFVDVEGSGADVTTITCACGSMSHPGGVLTAGAITAEVRHLTIANTGGGDYSTALSTALLR